MNKWNRRRNLKGHHFEVTALQESPFISKIKLNTQTGLYEIEGSFADLLKSLAKTMNFTFTLKPPPDNSWGGKLENGSWNGMINLLQNEMVDFGTHDFFYKIAST